MCARASSEEMIVENNIMKMPDLNYIVNPNGLGYELFFYMKKNQDLLAQVDSDTGEQDTYGQLLERCIRTSITMKARKISTNDVICVCSYNHLDSCVPYIAGLFVGAKLCALDPSISFNDSKYLLTLVKPRIIFVVPEKRDTYQMILNDTSIDAELVVFGDQGSNSLGIFLRESEEVAGFVPEKAGSVFDTAVIMFSSGTTGLPKGICLNHFSLLSQAKNYILFNFDTRMVLGYASLYWISTVFLLLQCILNGTARLLCKSFIPADACRIISKYNATYAFMAPNQAIAILKQGKSIGTDTKSLQDLTLGGTPMSSENLLAMREFLPNTNISLAYGLTEIAGAGLIFSNNLSNYSSLLQSKPKSCGKPISGIWYKVVDLETEEALPCHRIGELRLKTKLQMNGYHNRDSSEAWDSDGWLRTGDVCYYDEDYCFYIVDRIKEMMKFQSWHVPPALLEGILQEHVAVKTAVVFGVPHDEDGEHPMAAVVRSNNAEGIEAETLLEYVNSRVDDRQKLRGGIVFVEEIDYTPTGKIQRKLLKESILRKLQK